MDLRLKGTLASLIEFNSGWRRIPLSCTRSQTSGSNGVRASVEEYSVRIFSVYNESPALPTNWQKIQTRDLLV
jgi:hypothetical protein